MDSVLQGIPGVACYIDDILVSTKDEQSHMRALGKVFRRLKEHGLRLKKDKCDLLTSSVEYLGHLIDQDAIRPLPSKVISDQAPAPTNVQELRSLLSMPPPTGWELLPPMCTLTA